MHEFQLLLSPAEGALVRVLGTIERRGFMLRSVESRPAPRGVNLSFTLAASNRSPEVLLRQIQRLHDVLDARFELARPVFQLPARALPTPPPMPTPARSGMSFLGIPERISSH